MSDLNKYSPPPQSSDLYMAASKHFQQAKMILENIPNPDYEVRLKYWEEEYLFVRSHCFQMELSEIMS